MDKTNRIPIDAKFVEQITGGLTLVGLGLILLCNTLGILSWTVWGTFAAIFIKFWPLLLVGLGLQIIFSKSIKLKIISNLIWTCFVFGIFVISILSSLKVINLPSNLTAWSFSLDLQKNDTKTYESVKKTSLKTQNLTYTFNMTTGTFNFKSMIGLDSYLSLVAELPGDNGVPKIVTESDDEFSEIKFKQEFPGESLAGLNSNATYLFNLDSGSIPSNAIFNMTSGNMTGDFKNLELKTLNYTMTSGNAKMGVGESIEKIDIEITSGELTIGIPKSLGLNINSSSTLGSVTVDREKLEDGQKSFNGDGLKVVELNLKLTTGELKILRY